MRRVFEGVLVVGLCACGADGRTVHSAEAIRTERAPLRWPELPVVPSPAPKPTVAAVEPPTDPRADLLAAMDDGDPLVRLEAVEEAWAWRADPLVRERLLELLDDPDEDVACVVIETLEGKEPEIRDHLFVVVRDRRDEARQVAARALLQGGTLRGRWLGFVQSVMATHHERQPRLILLD